MKTAIYMRVSTNRQTQAQTIEQQLERLQRHLELQGEPRLTENVFRDDGYSGANLNRPGLDRLRDRVKGGVLDRVLLTSPDRLARNYVHQMVLVEEWERSGCKVEFLDRPMSQDPHDQLLLQIRGAVAEDERTRISERMRRGLLMKLQAGQRLPEAGIPTPQGQPRWNVATVRGMLRNPAYPGTAAANRTQVVPPRKRQS